MTAHRVTQDLLNAPFQVNDPGDAGTIVLDRDRLVCPVDTDTTETRILPQPTKAGLIATVVLDDDGGDLTLTVKDGYNRDSGSADQTITFADAGDFATFISVKIGTDYYWRLLAHEGTDAAVEDVTTDQLTATSGTVTTLNSTTAGLSNATLGRMQVTTTAVNAAGSEIANAAALGYGRNLVAAADNATGVILPVAVANATVDVISTVNAKSLKIYPQVNSQIAAMGANTALVLGPTNTGAAVQLQFASVRLVATNATQWYVVA